MSRQSPLFNERGFTLIEMMVATSLVSVVLLAIMSTTGNFNQSTLAFRRSVPSTIEREQFQDYFSRLAQAAWVSTEYLHLPVSWSAAGGAPCVASDTGPCIRRQGYSEAGVFVGGQTTFQEVTTAVPTPASAYIDFYRDEISTLTSTPVYPQDANNYLVHSIGLAQFQTGATTDVGIGETYLQTDYFATWRLDDTTSAPFFILSQYPSRNAFVFSNDTGALRTFRFTPTDPGMQGAAAAGARTALATAIQTGLMLVYNSADPRQYTIQYITTATAAADNIHFDFVLKPVNTAGSPIATGTPHAWYRSGGAYNPVLNSALYTWQGTCGNVWATIQNDPAANGFYLFPSEYFSFCNNQPADGALHDWPVGGQPFAENPAGGGVDFGSIAGYYTAGPYPAAGPAPLTPVPQLIGIPLIATAFYLGAGVLPTGCSGAFPVANPPPGCPSTAAFYSLQSVSLPGQITRTHVGMVLPPANLSAGTAPVYFGRRLGTTKIEAFVK